MNKSPPVPVELSRTAAKTIYGALYRRTQEATDSDATPRPGKRLAIGELLRKLESHFPGIRRELEEEGLWPFEPESASPTPSILVETPWLKEAH